MANNDTYSTKPVFTTSGSAESAGNTVTVINTDSLGPSAGEIYNSGEESWIVKVPDNRLMPNDYTEVLDVFNIQYLNGYLRTQIGNYCTAEVLFGSREIEERSGLLAGVGVNYIILKIPDTEDTTIIDFYAIKTITVYA